jgi:RHS repeat-associated protein
MRKNHAFLVVFVASFCLLLALPKPSEAAVFTHTEAHMSNIQITPMTGTLSWLTDWEVEASSSVFESISGFDWDYDDDFDDFDGEASAGASTAYTSASASTSSNNITLDSATNANLPDNVNLSHIESESTMYRDFEIAESGPVDVHISYNYSAEFMGQATGVDHFLLKYATTLEISDGFNNWDLTSTESISGFDLSTNESYGGLLDFTVTLLPEEIYSVTARSKTWGDTVPEPATYLLISSGLLLILYRRKKNKKIKHLPSPNKYITIVPFLFFTLILCPDSYSCDGSGQDKDPCNNKVPANSFVSLIEGAMGDDYSVVNLKGGNGGNLNLSLYFHSHNAYFEMGNAVNTSLGLGWTHTYNKFLFRQRGRMFRNNEKGRTTIFTRIPGSSPAQYRPTEGYFETMVRNSDGTFTITYEDGIIEDYARIPNSPYFYKSYLYHLTERVDRNGNITSLTYTNGRLSEITGPYGRKITLSYYPNNKIKTITDPIQRVTRFAFDPLGTKLLKITDPDINTVEYTYDNQYQITRKVDKNGNTSIYNYLNVKPVSVTDGNGSVLFSLTNPTNWAIDPNACLRRLMREYIPSTTTKSDGRGNQWKYEYNKNGYITRTIAPDGAETKKTYDPFTLKESSVTDANGHTTSYEYDPANGNLKKITDHLTNVTRYEYANPSCEDRVTKITYPNDSITVYEYDAKCNLTKEIRDVGGLNLVTEWLNYDLKGNYRQMKDPNGHITYYEYNAHGNLKKLIDPENNVARYEYDVIGNRTKMIDGNNNETSYKYDALDRLAKKTDPLGFVTEYEYDSKGNQIEVKKKVTKAPDPEIFQVTQFEYDLRDRLIRKTNDPADLNLMTAYTYDENNNRISITDARGKVTQFDYDAQNRLTRVTDALTNTTETLYDPVGNRICIIDANGHYTFYEYDPLNRLEKESRKIGAQECKTGDSDDIVTKYFYDNGGGGCSSCTGPTPGSNNITKIIDSEEKVSCFKYDAVDRRTAEIRKVGDKDCSVVDDNDWIEQIEFDSVSNIVKRIDASGNTTSFIYYDNNWLQTEVIDPGGLNETTTYIYDGVGNVDTVHTPNGNTIDNTYSFRNELIQVDDTVGRVARFGYDGVGNRILECDGNDYCTVFSYDLVNRLVQIVDPMGEPTEYDYDKNGNLIKVTDREDHVTCHLYDAINRRTRTTKLIGGTDCAFLSFRDIWTDTEYDGVGNVTRLITASDNSTPAACASGSPPSDCQVTAYQYDEADRLRLETYADGTTRQFSYNKAGNLAERIDQLGQVTQYSYNDLNYLIKRDYQDPAHPDDAFEYDTGGRMISAVRNGWVVTFDEYDGANRVLQTTQDATGIPMVVKYEYNIPDRTRTVIYPGGRIITENTDQRQRLETIDDAFSPPAIVNYEYDLGNRVLIRTYRNGVVASYSYIDNNWITSLAYTNNSSTIAHFTYHYDKEGNVDYEEKIHDPGNSEAYKYYDVYRLLEYKVGQLDLGSGDVPVPTYLRSYDLDKVGNWVQFTVDDDGGGPDLPILYNNTPNQMNEYDDWSTNGPGEIPDDLGLDINFADPLPTPPEDGENWAHDKNGNRREDGKRFYEYDDENRLIRVIRKSDEVISEYHYDALGRRVVKIVDALNTSDLIRYAYDDARVIEEQDGSGDTEATYVYGNYIDEVLTMHRGGQDYFYHKNAHWSVVAVTDAAANVVERYAYSDYGSVSVTDEAGTPVVENDYAGFQTAHSIIGNPYMFTGRRWDEESGLYYYRARFYDCEKGRFLQRDPLEYVDGINLYEYVRGNPRNNLDPYGSSGMGKSDSSKPRGKAPNPSPPSPQRPNPKPKPEPIIQEKDLPIHPGEPPEAPFDPNEKSGKCRTIPPYNHEDEGKPCCCSPAKLSVKRTDKGVVGSKLIMNLTFTSVRCVKDMRIWWGSCQRPDRTSGVMPKCTNKVTCTITGVKTWRESGILRSTGPHLTWVYIQYLSCEKNVWVERRVAVNMAWTAVDDNKWKGTTGPAQQLK